MLKAKLVFAKVPISMSDLSSRMMLNQFSDSSKEGFLLSVSDGKRLTGKYIEKYTEVSVVIDPFGNSNKVETEAYYLCKFNLTDKSCFMSVIDPPRSLRKFINALHDVTGLGLVVSEANIELTSWIKELEMMADEFTVSKLSTSGINSSESSTAKLAITGTKDVRDVVELMLKQKRYTIDSITFNAVFDGLHTRCELSRTGSCKISSQDSEKTLWKLKSALENTLRCDR